MTTVQEKILLYKKLVGLHLASVVKGETIPYTALNGHMYSYFNKNGFVALRLPDVVKAAFIKKYNTTLVTACGIVQKEYVVVPDSLLANTEELLSYLEAGHDYVSSLKPKPAKGSKKEGK